MGEEAELEVLRLRLLKAERRATVAEVATALVHELKNPLAPIQGYAQMLRARLGGVSEADRPRFDEGLSIIEREAQRMEGLLRMFLEDAHRAFLRSSGVDAFALDTVVAESVRLVRGRLGGSELHCDGIDTLGVVRGDADSIRSALVNVLHNALDAVRERRGWVHIFCRQEEGWQVIEVVDNGPGFGEEPSRYLRPFVTSKEGGTGLGLALAAAALESAGGELTVGNQEGGGACVRLMLPAGPR